MSEPTEAKTTKRTYILPPEDEARLQRLRDLYAAGSEVDVTLADAVRIALRDAARHRGLEADPSKAGAKGAAR